MACRAFGNAMSTQRRGSIINISSIYGMVAPDMSIYEGVDFETEPDYPFVKGWNKLHEISCIVLLQKERAELIVFRRVVYSTINRSHF